MLNMSLCCFTCQRQISAAWAPRLPVLRVHFSLGGSLRREALQWLQRFQSPDPPHFEMHPALAAA